MAHDAIAPHLGLGYLLLRRLTDLLDQFGEIAVALLQKITSVRDGGRSSAPAGVRRARILSDSRHA